MESKNKEVKIILASSSPVRRAILERLRYDFEVVPSDFDERSVKIKDTKKLVEALALEKARTVARKYPNRIIIGADTMIEFNGISIGKADSPEQARKYLKRLRGVTHKIISGLAIIDTSIGEERSGAVESKVTMKNYPDRTIDEYIVSGQWKGKAAAYDWHGLGRQWLIGGVEGEETAVEGLPVSLLKSFLKELKVKVIDNISH